MVRPRGREKSEKYKAVLTNGYASKKERTGAADWNLLEARRQDHKPLEKQVRFS